MLRRRKCHTHNQEGPERPTLSSPQAKQVLRILNYKPPLPGSIPTQISKLRGGVLKNVVISGETCS